MARPKSPVKSRDRASMSAEEARQFSPDMLDVPKSFQSKARKEGSELRWVGRNSRQFDNAKRKGYVLVDAKDYNEKNPRLQPDGSLRTDSTFTTGGDDMVLMERSKEVGDNHRAYLKEKANRPVQNIKERMNKLSAEFRQSTGGRGKFWGGADIS